MVNIRLHALKRWLAGASMPRYGYDGINVDAAIIARLFPKASFVCGYDTGGWPWSAQAWGLFPHASRVHIVTQAHYHLGDVLDVETGDATPAQAEAWIAARHAAGYYKPTIYCSLSLVPAVRAGTGKFVLGRDYDLWVAHWTGKPHVAYRGAVVTQYASRNSYDSDVAYSAAWPQRKAPVVPPKPTPKPQPAEPELVAGEHGAAVKVLQARLNAFGAKLKVDGIFGPATLTAVEHFQKVYKIKVDGIVGPVTWAMLRSHISSPQSKATRHVSHGSVSLHAAASFFNTTVEAIVTTSLALETPKNQKALIAYLAAGCGAANPAPKGLVFWTPAVIK